ncbi:Rpn family recombination-promoting nuclease/putative transposase [Thiohalocapsa marina]|uniref:Rpn family recombination-promoting nuclease/putative transposase n=1 Tax=Thiohalocapsa marina TaxID=424902 RepID=UPI0036D83F63
MSNHHDTGYKELFSHPEFVQQLIEGFAPPEIAQLMDFSTLENHSGHYITPLFEERIEDLVWSVRAHWQGLSQQVYLYLLLEFQSGVDSRMPIRLLHYVACFYDHLLKTKAASVGEGLPPVFPVVLYNGATPWSAETDIYGLLQPEPPAFLRPYQPRLRYYVIDEGRLSVADLAARQTPLSAVFSLENAATGEALQQAVERAVAVMQADPHKERIDRVVTRWFKRHLQRIGTPVDLSGLNSLIEDRSMLAENIQNWIRNERQEGHQEGRQEGESLALQRVLSRQIQLKFGALPDWAEQRLAQATLQQLEDWSAAILFADSIEALLGGQ